MDEEKLIEKLASEEENKPIEIAKQTNKKHSLFQKFKIKDIVFLAIMASCMLITGAIMPLVGQIPIFGIIQICLGLQFSLFPNIGLMKVRKTGSLLFMSLCCGVILVFMNPIMFVCLLICALIAESLVLIFFHGYKNDISAVIATSIYFPLTLPFLYLYYRFLYSYSGEEGAAVNAFIGSDPLTAILMSICVLAICIIGSIGGYFISKEFKKAGVMKP